VRFLEPVFDGEELVSRADGGALECRVAAAVTGSESVRAVLAGRVESGSAPAFGEYEDAAAPEKSARPAIAAELLQPGVVLGSLRVDLAAEQGRVLGFLADPLEAYRGADALAHPTVLLGLINRLLTANFAMPAWIHTQSEIRTWSAPRVSERVSVRGRVAERFDRKGHEFVLVDAAIGGADGRLCQQIRHTAIYKLREKG
jgi:hypothetical protein